MEAHDKNDFHRNVFGTVRPNKEDGMRSWGESAKELRDDLKHLIDAYENFDEVRNKISNKAVNDLVEGLVNDKKQKPKQV